LNKVIINAGGEEIDISNKIPNDDPGYILVNTHKSIDIDGELLYQIMNEDITVKYIFNGCKGKSYSYSYDITFDKCYGWNANGDISLDRNNKKIITDITTDKPSYLEPSIFVLYMNGEKLAEGKAEDIHEVEYIDILFEIDGINYEMKEVKIELKERCNSDERIVKEGYLTPGPAVCETNNVRDVFVSLLSTKANHENGNPSSFGLTLSHENANFTVSALPYHQQGMIWHLCSGTNYDISQLYSNDRVVIRTHNEILFDSYNNPDNHASFTVDDDNIVGECHVTNSDMLDFELIQNGGIIKVKFSEQSNTNESIVDIFDNGVFVTSLDTTGGNNEVSYKLYNIEDGYEHSITVREYCKSPVSLTKNIIVYLPCKDDTCSLYLYESNDLPNGYIEVRSKDNSDITYFVGAPSGSISGNTYIDKFSVCKYNFEAKLILPVGSNVNSNSKIILIHNDTNKVHAIRTEYGYAIEGNNIPDDVIVVDHTFTDKDDAPEFFYTCERCYLVTEPKVTLSYFYVVDEVFSLSINAEFNAEVIHLDYFYAIVDEDGGNKTTIDITPKEFTSGNYTHNFTGDALKSLIGKNVCAIYSFSGCNSSSNSNNPMCVTLDGNGLSSGAVAGIVIGCIAAAGIILAGIYCVFSYERGKKPGKLSNDDMFEEEPGVISMSVI